MESTSGVLHELQSIWYDLQAREMVLKQEIECSKFEINSLKDATSKFDKKKLKLEEEKKNLLGRNLHYKSQFLSPSDSREILSLQLKSKDNHINNLKHAIAAFASSSNAKEKLEKR